MRFRVLSALRGIEKAFHECIPISEFTLAILGAEVVVDAATQMLSEKGYRWVAVAPEIFNAKCLIDVQGTQDPTRRTQA